MEKIFSDKDSGLTVSWSWNAGTRGIGTSETIKRVDAASALSNPRPEMFRNDDDYGGDDYGGSNMIK